MLSSGGGFPSKGWAEGPSGFVPEKRVGSKVVEWRTAVKLLK